MKKVKAKQMHNNPAPVFRTADREGKIEIEHKHYPDRRFILIAEDKKNETKEP